MKVKTHRHVTNAVVRFERCLKLCLLFKTVNLERERQRQRETETETETERRERIEEGERGIERVRETNEWTDKQINRKRESCI